MKSSLSRRKDGSYILKHKTRKGKKDDCVECGQNEKNRELGLLYRHVSNDMMLVRDYIEHHLTEYLLTSLVVLIFYPFVFAFHLY